jgi:hypothetical protein
MEGLKDGATEEAAGVLAVLALVEDGLGGLALENKGETHPGGNPVHLLPAAGLASPRDAPPILHGGGRSDEEGRRGLRGGEGQVAEPGGRKAQRHAGADEEREREEEGEAAATRREWIGFAWVTASFPFLPIFFLALPHPSQP